MSLVSNSSWAVDDESVSIAEYNLWAEKNDDQLKGEMNCKITDQIILAVQDGKTIRYVGAKDQPIIGDSLTFTYDASERNFTFVLGNSSHEYLDENLRKGFGATANFGRTSNFSFDRLVIRQNSLVFRSTNPLRSKTLQLHRYYKSDWGGMLTFSFHGKEYKSTQISTQILTLDCRTIKDSIDAILFRFATYPGHPFSNN